MSRGKTIEKFTCQAGDGREVTVPIKMHVGEGDGYGTTFSAAVPEASISITEQNIDTLRTKIREKLAEWSVVEWRAVLVVKAITVRSDYRSDDARLDCDTGFSVKAFLVSEDADGRPQYMSVPLASVTSGTWNGKRHQSDYHSKISQGLIGFASGDEDTDTWHRAEGARIPATPANFAALEHLSAAFKALNDRLCELIAPDAVGAFLAGLKTTPQLSFTDSGVEPQGATP